MTKRLLVLVATFLLLTGSNAQQETGANWFSIKGFLPQWNAANAQLLVNGEAVYNGKVQKDLLSYTGQVTGIQEGLLKITQHKQTLYLPLFIEPGTIKIRDEGKRLVVYGTASNEAYWAIMQQLDSLAILQSNKRFEEVKAYKRDLATVYIIKEPVHRS